jgi:hypothetical protein
MGLDMYLNARINTVDKKILGFPVSHTEVSLACWRKANQIHRWFVTNVQDGEDECNEYFVTTDQLRTLLATVDDVLEHRQKAPHLLPTQSGFFFGSDEYGAGYWEDLRYTASRIKKILVCWSAKIESGEVSMTYQSSW